MKKLTKLLSIALALMLLAGLAPVMAEGLTLTDMLDREVTLKGPAERVVALAASDVEILYAIGAGDALVGRGTYCNYPAEALEVQDVQSGAETNLEQIVALTPDVVIMPKMAQDMAQVEALEKAGVAVVMTDPQNIEGVHQAILLLGAVTGKAEEAEKVSNTLKERLDAVAEKAKEKKLDASVYFETSPLEWGLWTAGKGTFMDEIAQILGVKNAFGDLEGWQAISPEQVIARDPDYIITTTMYMGEGPTPLEELTGRAGWENVKAIKNGQCYNADGDEITRPGPRLADAAEALFAFIYP